MTSRPKVRLSEKGSCACGGATIAANGPVLSMFLCTCTECQKATGAGHAAIALMRARDVTSTGALKSFTRQADSGATLTRHFCPDCGVTVYGTSSRIPDLVLLSPGQFPHADWFAPNQVIFSRSHLDWDTLPPDIPHYETYNEAR